VARANELRGPYQSQLTLDDAREIAKGHDVTLPSGTHRPPEANLRDAEQAYLQPGESFSARLTRPSLDFGGFVGP
jgi:hypothetical protein